MRSHRASSCPDTSTALRNTESSSSTESDTSDRSKSTAPTIYSDLPMSKRQEDDMDETDLYDEIEVTPAGSASTLGSTTTSIDETEEPPLLEVTDRRRNMFVADAIPSSSSTFGKLFPSGRRLLIRHDDATLDGNMNLRVDTMVPHRAGYQQDVTLFHLRMYDLFTRKFSFRRYCRESGREICHSEGKAQSSPFGKAPMLRRSWSSVVASLRPGYGGNGPIPGTSRSRRGSEQSGSEAKVNVVDRAAALTDSTMLEFSNYAHVELKRKGAGIIKRNEYLYWGTKYQWRRESRKEGDLREVSYHLVNMRTSKKVAHIVPEILTPSEAIEEESKGGWISPSSMWLSDPSVYKHHDVAE